MALPQAQLPCSGPAPGHDISLVVHPQAMPQPCCYLSSVTSFSQQGTLIKHRIQKLEADHCCKALARPEHYVYVRWSIQACLQKNPGTATIVKLPWNHGCT